MAGEGGDLGMRVRITPVIDQGKLNGEAKKVEGTLSKKLKLGVGGNLSGLLKGGGMGNAAVAGAVGGIFASAMQGLMSIGKKMLGAAVEASGMLKGTLKMLNMGFMMIVKPIGDTLAMMLRPIALFFRLIGREIMKRVRAKRKELKAQGLTGMDLGLALMAEIPSIYLDVFMEFAEKVDWNKILTKIGESVWEFLTEKLPIILEKLRELGVLVLKKILEAIGDMPILATLGLLVLGAIVLAIGAMVVLGTLGALVLGTMTTAIGTMSVLNGLGNSVFSRIMTSIGTMSVLGTLGTAILSAALLAVNSYVNSPSAQTDLEKLLGVKPLPADVPKPSNYNDPINRIGQSVHVSDLASGRWQKPFEDVYNMLGGKGPLIPGLASGGLMTSDGLIYAHAGEAVIGTDSLRGMIADAISVNNSNTIVIPGSVIADAIDRRVDYYYKYKVANRR